jgi:hypothetical protein
MTIISLVWGLNVSDEIHELFFSDQREFDDINLMIS